jgi:hypothetical protein
MKRNSKIKIKAWKSLNHEEKALVTKLPNITGIIETNNEVIQKIQNAIKHFVLTLGPTNLDINYKLFKG